MSLVNIVIVKVKDIVGLLGVSCHCLHLYLFFFFFVFINLHQYFGALILILILNLFMYFSFTFILFFLENMFFLPIFLPLSKPKQAEASVVGSAENSRLKGT